MNLVERDALLADLSEEAAVAAKGSGRLVVLGGAAGVGKTSVARALADQLQTRARVLWGTCDALSTPRPLGPLRDMAGTVPHLAGAFASEIDRHELFHAYLEVITNRHTLMVIEDVHWADEATFDFIRFLGRRIDRTRGLMLATFRDDEVESSHPLRAVLGDIATAPGHRRVAVEALSRDGVEALAAGLSVDAEDLHRKTGGNPFFVTEVLANPGEEVPATVTDAVLARASRLSPESVAVLETVSAQPVPVELTLLQRLGHADDAVQEAISSGMLVSQGTSLTFRHELARLALLERLDAPKTRDLHRRIYETLEEASNHEDPARLAHHAERADLPEAVLKWAPAAARVASRSGSHREAASHYGDALRRAAGLDTRDRAALLDAHANELAALDRVTEVVEKRRQLVDLWRELDDAAALAIAQARLAIALWRDGRGDEARQLTAAVMDAMDDTADRSAAAHVYTVAATLATLARQGPEALSLGERAVATATESGEEQPLVSALNLWGSAKILFLEDMAGVADLERAGDLAAVKGWDDRLAAVYTNLGASLGEIRRYRDAEEALQAGIDYCAERDLDANANYCFGWLARVRFEQGQWASAMELVEQVLSSSTVRSPIIDIVSLGILGRLRSRAGEGDADAPFDEAWERAKGTGELQRLWPIAAGRAELAWLRDQPTANDDLLEVLAMAESRGLRWAIGELGFWAWKLGLRREIPEGAAEPYRLQVAGKVSEAADAWKEIGCPYESALALSESESTEDLRLAMESLVELGARPLGERVRKALRERGVTRGPTFPRTVGGPHPSGLSPRELDVLELLAEGLTDRSIAGRLFVSARTVNHHVAAILRKLEVDSRTEAAARAHREGWSRS